MESAVRNWHVTIEFLQSVDQIANRPNPPGRHVVSNSPIIPRTNLPPRNDRPD